MKRLLLSAAFIAAISSKILAANNSEFVSMNVPATVDSGATFGASMTFKNTGDAPWADGFVLGSESLRDNSRWGINRMVLANGPVAPGANGTFTNSFAAPTSPGIYNFAWRP